MAEKAKEISNEAPEQASGGRRKNIVMFGVLAGVMIVEALVVIILVKSFLGPASPQSTHAASQPADPGGLVTTEGERRPARAEIKIGEFRAQNRRGQLSYLLEFTVFAVATEQDKPKVEEVVVGKAATIKDRFCRVVRGMDPERFIEPDLTTLRTQLKEELGQVLGPDLKIQEVLLTDFTSALDS